MICDCCGYCITDNDFINVNGGALLRNKNNPHVSHPSRKLQEFLSINLHDDSMKVYKSVELVVNDENSVGQFEWYFCNKKCVRQFFNDWLDKIPDVGESDGN